MIPTHPLNGPTFKTLLIFDLIRKCVTNDQYAANDFTSLIHHKRKYRTLSSNLIDIYFPNKKNSI